MLEMRIWSRPADIIRHGSVAGLKSVQWICPQSETKAKGFFNLHDVPCQYVLIISTPSLLKAGQALFPPGFFMVTASSPNVTPRGERSHAVAEGHRRYWLHK